MADYTPEQVAAAARLVPECVFTSGYGVPYIQTSFEETGAVTRDWQPWANTEVGRSDALVLSRAVDQWWSDADSAAADAVAVHVLKSRKAWLNGTMQEWLDANFAAAAAIGRHMRESE